MKKITRCILWFLFIAFMGACVWVQFARGVTLTDTNMIKDLAVTEPKLSAAAQAKLNSPQGLLYDSNVSDTAGINPSKLSDGSVDDTEFKTLNGVTSGIQGQINTKIGKIVTLTDNAGADSVVIKDSDGTIVAVIDSNGNIKSAIAGGGLFLKEGSNCTMGDTDLVAGTATISTTKVTANSRIFLTVQSTGGTPGAVYVSSRIAGTSFTISDTSGTDTSNVAWMIIEPD